MFFPAAPRSPGSWHRGGEHAMALQHLTTELRDNRKREVKEQAARLYALGGLTWHDI